MPVSIIAAAALAVWGPDAPAAQATAQTPPKPSASVVAAPIPQNTWVIVAADNSSGAAYDAGSIRRAPDQSTAMMSTLLASRTALTRDGKPVHYLLAKNEFDCRTSRKREGAVLGLDAAGKPVASEETPGEWQAIAPGAVEEGFRALACKSANPDVKIAQGPLAQILAEFQKRFAS